MEIIHFFWQFKSDFVKIIVAMFLSGLIGWERERHGRPAGFRTHILVGVGSALFMLISEQIFAKYQGLDNNSVLRIDPARIAAGIVSGIGFLGVGTIMRYRASVRGLTTASCLWVVAGIGMAVGTGFIVPAIFTTIIAIIVLLVFARFEEKIPVHSYRTLKIWVKDENFDLSSVEKIIEKYSTELLRYKFERDIEKNECMFDIDLKFFGKQELIGIAQELKEQIDGLRKLEWE